jgi:hypothetical protein
MSLIVLDEIIIGLVINQHDEEENIGAPRLIPLTRQKPIPSRKWKKWSWKTALSLRRKRQNLTVFLL